MRLAAVLGLALLCCACSTRRVLEIDSDPTGARIWVDGFLQEKVTPLEIEFTHARRFDVRVEKQGYQSVNQEIQVDEGIEGWPLIDLIFETIKRERRYERVVTMPALGPQPTESDVQALLKRAEAFRERTYREAREAKPPERLLPSNELLP